MDFRRITAGTVRGLLPKRKADTHKGDYGNILLLCGSVGFTGAAALAAKAAVRCGAGLVSVGVPQEVYPIVAGKLDEPMVFPLPDADGCFSAMAQKEILSRLPKTDAVLFGCGTGKTEGVLACLRTVLENSTVPVVVDADGINLLAKHIDVLRESACPVIVTPHYGEFLRLGGNRDADREEAAATLARELGCICVLKGPGTVVTDGKTCLVNTTGNPGMATGGSGDVLAGMLVSLLGQGLSPMDAAAAAVWLHGRAGDICARKLGQYAMLPSDMITALTRLLP